MKAQVSVELMIVIGFILVFFIPLLLVAYFTLVDLNQDLSSVQAEVSVSKISNTIDSIGWMGNDSSLILDVYLPVNSELQFKSYDPGGEVILTLQETAGGSESVGTTWFGISPVPNVQKTGGNYRFNITSKGEQVSVTASD